MEQYRKFIIILPKLICVYLERMKVFQLNFYGWLPHSLQDILLIKIFNAVYKIKNADINKFQCANKDNKSEFSDRDILDNA